MIKGINKNIVLESGVSSSFQTIKEFIVDFGFVQQFLEVYEIKFGLFMYNLLNSVIQGTIVNV